MGRAAFEQMLQGALAHLYDPSYEPPERLWQALSAPSAAGRRPMHMLLVEAIQAMAPPAGMPVTARAHRYYELLNYRYVQELTQKETARRLQISPRHLRREQQQAVQALAQRLYEPHGYELHGYEPQAPPEMAVLDPPTQGKTNSWLENVQQEVAALRDVEPNIRARVELDMARAVKLMEGVLASRGISLVLSCDEELEADVHPSVLRQVLITAIEDLAKHMARGTLELNAQRRGNSVEIVVIGDPVADSDDDRRTSEWRVLAAQTGAAEFRQVGTKGIIRLRFPWVRRVSVLVIDDNDDVIHVFKRYVSGTQYQVHRLATPFVDVQQQVAELRPDIIVLDVLMPNLDGWELLASFRQHALTAKIPVIVCSVIRREELAHTLGAAAHLSKPVKSQQFLETLDRVWQTVSAA